MRTRTGVCLAALLLVVASGCGTRTGPPAAPPLPPPTLPWLEDGRLHTGSTTLPMTADRVLVSAGTTVVGEASERRSRWWVLDRGRLAELVDAPAYVVPVLSADGGTAAWTAGRTVGRTAGRTLTAYDVPTRTVLGRTQVAPGVEVAVVANDGRVGLAADGAVLVWRAGDEPSPASWRDFGGRPRAGAVTSPDETREAGPDLVVRDRRTGERTDLDLPAGRGWAVAAWEDDDHVLVARAVGGPAPEVRRCDATTGDCGT